MQSNEVKRDILRLLDQRYTMRRIGFLRYTLCLAWPIISEAVGLKVSTVKNYFRKWLDEPAGTLHCHLSGKAWSTLQKLGYSTMSGGSAARAEALARSYFENGRLRGTGIGRRTANEILNAVEDYYECRRNRKQTA